MTEEKYEYYLRFLIVGNKYVGQKSLAGRYVEGEFGDDLFYPGESVRKKNIN